MNFQEMLRFIAAVSLLLPTRCLYLGDSCVEESRPGTCRQLSDCPPLLEAVRAAGTPMPAYIRRRLHAASCGFLASQPLVCCVQNGQTASPSRDSENWQGDQGFPSTGQNTNSQWNNPHGNDKPWTGHYDNDGWDHSENSGTSWGVYEQGTTDNSHHKPNQHGGSGNINNVHNNREGEWSTNRPDRNDDSDNSNSINHHNGVTNAYNNDNDPPDVSRHRNLRKLPDNCGVIEEDRIWGGNRTSLYEMPWMVLIAYDSKRGTKLSCAGALVTRWYVLTAAHCVSHLGSLNLTGVILGEHDVRGDPDCERIEGQLQCAPSSTNVTIAYVVPHPGYSPTNLVDDIALIRLSEPADFRLDNRKPICLPTTRELQTENLTDKQGVVAGWGATESGLQSPVLLKVDLPVLSNDDCKRRYNGNPQIHGRQLCAGGVQDKDSCGGDSGGPLLYPGRPAGARAVRYVQRGIVSFGSKRCGVGGYPGVYTRVAHYMDWILDNITD